MPVVPFNFIAKALVCTKRLTALFDTTPPIVAAWFFGQRWIQMIGNACFIHQKDNVRTASDGVRSALFIEVIVHCEITILTCFALKKQSDVPHFSSTITKIKRLQTVVH